MQKKKKSWLSLLNPFEWIHAALVLLAALFSPLLRLLGLMPHPNTEHFENIKRSDVDDAETLAMEQEAAVDHIIADISPAEVVRAYARADTAGRATMDLSALDFAQQDWLMRLTDEELSKLAMSTTGGCARSLEAMEVRPVYAKPTPETETAETLAIPTVEDIEEEKRQFIAARYRELFVAPGAANPNPRYVPGLTVH
jgi:hypothetical protein